MRIKHRLAAIPIIIGIVAIFFSACNRNAVTLSFTNAKGEVPILGNLKFRFNQSMVKDSLLNRWDSADYISFEPAIKGRFRWESPDELVFSPAQPLNPATTYKAKIEKAVLKFSPYNSVKDGDKINFHTPDLLLNDSRVVWIGETSTSAVPQIDLLFNYRIVPSDLKDKLNVEIEGKKMDYNLITQSAENKISIRVNGLKTEDKDLEAKISIGKGLKPESGNNTTSEIISSTFNIPSPYVLIIQNVEAQHDGTEGTVSVTTSQQLWRIERRLQCRCCLRRAGSGY
jgi:hypothetical protein